MLLLQHKSMFTQFNKIVSYIMQMITFYANYCQSALKLIIGTKK